MAKVPAGGPSTINGVLYQMLWSLFRTACLRLAEPPHLENDVIHQATLILEPRDGGGDQGECHHYRRFVDQLKARPDLGPWSLREVVEDVLPDLYKAVEINRSDTEFRFVTEGCLGGWPKVYDFFRGLKHRPCPVTDVLSGLEDTKRLPFRTHTVKNTKASQSHEPSFWPKDSYTERSLFARIVEVLQARPKVVGQDTPETVRQKLWHLLAHFEFLGDQTADYLEKRIHSVLVGLVNASQDAVEKRLSMLQRLAEKARQGQAEINAKKFFEEANLTSVSLAEWSLIRERGERHLAGQLALRGYSAHEDVRRGFVSSFLAKWAVDKPLLALLGESGQGKSWTLYASALEVAAEKELVILIEASGSAQGDLDRAAAICWQEIKGNDGPKSLQRISDDRRRILHAGADRWLTLLIDGVEEASEARDLARQDWEGWGIRLAISCPPEVAHTFRKEARGRSVAFSIPDFTAPELQAFLTNHLGDDWPDVRTDVRDTLRRPLLAQIYRDIAKAAAWHPTNEYELYNRYWNRLHEDEQADHPLDAVRLQNLARALPDERIYPWPGERLYRAGFDDAAIVRLRRLGWLRAVTVDRFEVWHDRLLNWAVATGLVAGLVSSQLTLPAFCNCLRELVFDQQTYGGKTLAYVPLDALWLMAAPGSAVKHLTCNVIEALEGNP